MDKSQLQVFSPALFFIPCSVSFYFDIKKHAAAPRFLIFEGLFIMTPKNTTTDFPLDALKDYVDRKILPRMRVNGRPFSLQPTDLGNRNMIFFLEIQGEPAAVLKAYHKNRRLKNDLIASRFLGRCGINVPRPLFSDTSQRTANKFGCYFACEEKIDGRNLAELSDLSGVIPEVARFYAGLHRIQSSRWGKFTAGRKYGFTRYAMEKVAARLESLKGSGALLKTATCARWFEDRKKTVKTIKNYSLSHGDANRKNILLAKDRRVFIIDNEAIKYLPFPIEFYRLCFSLCADDMEAQKTFEENYFSIMPQARCEEFSVCREFFRAYVLLELAAYYTRKLKKAEAADPQRSFFDSSRTKILESLRELLGLA